MPPELPDREGSGHDDRKKSVDAAEEPMEEEHDEQVEEQNVIEEESEGRLGKSGDVSLICFCQNFKS